MINRKTILWLLLGLVIVAIAGAAFGKYKNNPDRLFARFETQLREGRFEELYDQSSDYVRLSMSKQQFMRQMRTAVAKLKAVDENLAFNRDAGWEKTDPAGWPEEQGFIFTVQKLEKNEAAAFAIVYWDNTGIFPRFKDIVITATDDPASKFLTEFKFNGVLSSEN